MAGFDPQYLQTSQARPVTSIDGITQMNDMLLKRKDDKRADEAQNMQRENSVLDRNMQAANFMYRASQDDITNKRNETIDNNAKVDREAQQFGLSKVDSAISSNPEVADMYHKLLSTDVAKTDPTVFNQQASQLKSKLAVMSANSDSPELTKIWKSRMDEIDNIAKSVSDYKVGVSKAGDVATASAIATNKVANDNKTETFYRVTKDEAGNPKYVATTVTGLENINKAKNEGEFITGDQYASAIAIATQNNKEKLDTEKATKLKSMELDKEANQKGTTSLMSRLDKYGRGWNGKELQAKVAELKKEKISDYDIANIIIDDNNTFFDAGNLDHNHAYFLEKANELLRLKAQQDGKKQVDDKSIAFPGKKSIDDLKASHERTFATSLYGQD